MRQPHPTVTSSQKRKRSTPTRERLWDRYGSLMDPYSVAYELGISVESVRNAISSSKNTQPWAIACRKAFRPIGRKTHRFETAEIANLIEGRTHDA